MLPPLKTHVAAGYQRPVKIKLLKGPAVLVPNSIIKSLKRRDGEIKVFFKSLSFTGTTLN